MNKAGQAVSILVPPIDHCKVPKIDFSKYFNVHLMLIMC